MRRPWLFIVLFGVALSLAASVLAFVDLGLLPWMVSRGTGVVAFGLLTASMVLGLGMSTRLANRIIPKPALYEIHSFISVLTLLFVLVHAGVLLFDGYAGFGSADILVPFASSYRPFATGLGVVAAWALVAVTVSSWLRPRLSYRVWRHIHYLSFGVWAAGLAHGVLAGSDAGNPLVAQLYWSGGASVAGLLTYRVLTAVSASDRQSESGTTRAGTGGQPRVTPAAR